MVYGDGQAGPCMVGAWNRCMGDAWYGVSINYLDGGFVRSVRLDLSNGVWFWMGCGDVIIYLKKSLHYTAQLACHKIPNPTPPNR